MAVSGKRRGAPEKTNDDGDDERGEHSRKKQTTLSLSFFFCPSSQTTHAIHSSTPRSLPRARSPATASRAPSKREKTETLIRHQHQTPLRRCGERSRAAPHRGQARGAPGARGERVRMPLTSRERERGTREERKRERVIFLLSLRLSPCRSIYRERLKKMKTKISVDRKRKKRKERTVNDDD